MFHHGEEDTLFERWYAQHTYKRLTTEGELEYKFMSEPDVGY
jgi:hypothetical protein